MKILTVVSSPGPAESLGLVVKTLRESGQEVELINVSSNSVNPRVKAYSSGSGKILQRLHLDYKEAHLFGSIEDYFNVQDTVADRIIDEIKPQKVLTGTYRDTSGTKMTLEDAVILSARRKRIPVFQFVDLWDNWFPKKNLNIIPDTFLVHDVWAKEIIRKRSPIEEERFFIVGSPALENFIQKEINAERFKKSDFGLDGKRVIAYFGQCAPIRNDITLPWVINCLQGNDILVFSKHPRDKRDYKNYIRNNNKVLELGISSDEILDFADVCITHTSTMGFKAALLNIKIINIILKNECPEFIDFCGGYPLTLSGGSCLVKTEKELEETLANEYKTSKEFKEILNTYKQHRSISKILNLLIT